MLEPQDRLLLLDALRPPEGYELHFAIGTTYTLDLLALLTAPLGFTLFELRGAPDGELGANDALLLLKTLRRYADRITLFCEAGRITVPRRHAILFGELEEAVVEVKAPVEGATFHPKVWILRFVADDRPVRYRLLCLSRNLTFDRSWDTLLSLDGELQEHRKLAHSANHPLADFVAALPAMAVRRRLPPRVKENVRVAQSELRRVLFETPDPFEKVAFWPLGIEGYCEWPFEDPDRLLIVSPFLSASALREMTEGTGKRHVLVSRSEALEELSPAQLRPFSEVLQLDPDLSVEQGGEECQQSALAGAGLHAKLYVAEYGWNSSVYTGSANATHAARNRNVEFLVELAGKRSLCGIDKILSSEAARTGLRDMLREFAPGDPVLRDAKLEELEKRLDEARAFLAEREWTATAELSGETKQYRLTLASEGGRRGGLPDGISAQCRPVLLPDGATRPLDGAAPFQVVFEPLSFEALSSFFAFEISAPGMEGATECQFLINARLVGTPDDRREAITQYLLRDRQQVVRFLLMLLSDSPDEITTGGQPTGSVPAAGAGVTHAAYSEALLEPLLRALDRDPARLDEVGRIVDDLRKTEEGRAKLPPGFDAIWTPIWAARQALSK
jgi:hypothetical protein